MARSTSSFSQMASVPLTESWATHTAGNGPRSILAERKAYYGSNAALSYKDPLDMVSGSGTYLYDQDGNEYLDCVNNVAHVGHCNPQVTSAVCKQLQTLNTNSRYLSSVLTTYVKHLVGTFPDPLKIAYMVCSGSEANDLALRICKASRPGATHVAVMGGAYHGHLTSIIPLSPYKFWGPGGEGKQPYVHVLPCPDPYRGRNMDGGAAARAVVRQAELSGNRIAAFFCESIPSCGGQIVLPDGYLEAVYHVMHEHGALCVADEVQCGFGRVGSAFWAFETQCVVPDIVTLGKPIGNGFPLGAVVTSAQLSDKFANGMEYFNTYGGCTAAAAAGLAVLTELQEKRMQQHALKGGNYLTAQLRQLAERWECMGDVRGLGLFLGIEVVRDRTTRAHAPVLASWIKERAKARRVLLSTDGPYDNVLKIKPPLVFGEEEADHLVAVLRSIFEEELDASTWAALMVDEEENHARVTLPRMQLYSANEQELASLQPARL